MTDIIRKRGDTYPIEFLITANGSPLDITGATFKLTVDPSASPVDGTTKLFELVGVITNALGGTVKFTPSLLQADNLGKFYYDLQMVDGATGVRTLLSAKYILSQDITK